MFKTNKKFKIFIVLFIFISIFIISLVKIYSFKGTKKNYKLDSYNYKINTEYLNYLSLSDEEKEKVTIIPNKYVYISNNIDSDSNEFELPSEYDLRNVDGNNFVTSNKNQGSRGICWAFSAVATMESSIIKNGYASIDNPQIFSEYQLDFALSDDGIKNYSGGERKLSTGNSASEVTNFINEGYSPVSLQNFGEEYYGIYPIDYGDVFELQNTEYFFPESSEIIETVDSSKINNIKKYIMKYGSIIVDTASPLGECSHMDSEDNVYIDVNSFCYTSSGHSMSAIGWDDNYSQTYEVNGEIYEVKGAWILKNSWGDIFPFVYLSYNSVYTDYYGLGTPEILNFDNSYSKAYNDISDNTLISYYNKPSDSIEKITKISFYHNGDENNEYMIYISNDGSDNYNYIDTIIPKYPGRTSIDMSKYSDEYSFLNSDSFSIKIVSNNHEGYGSLRGTESVYAFTKNINTTDDIGVRINEKTINYYDKTISIDITPNSFVQKKNLDIKIVDNNGEDLTQGQLTLLKYIKKNQDYIYTYKVNEQFPKDSDTNLKVQVYYLNNLIAEKDITVLKNNPISPYGDGSEEYPFIIMTEEQFLKISDNDDSMGYHYILGNDLDFSNYSNFDFYSPIGTYSHPFTGMFDGKGHTISNLNVTYKAQQSSIGIFGYTQNAIIKNIKLENCGFSSDKLTTYFGIVSGYDNDSEINNISIYGGHSDVYAQNVGTFVGYSELGAYTNIYSSHSLNSNSASYCGGLIGYFKNSGIYIAAFVGNLEYQNTNTCGGVVGYAIKSSISYIDVSFEGNTEDGYQGIADYISDSVIDNVFVFVRSQNGKTSKNSYISRHSINSFISNIYEMEYYNYSYEPLGYQKTTLKNIRHVNYDSENIENIFDLDDQMWEYVNNKPYLKGLNYTVNKFTLPGITYEYLFDPNDLIIYNVRIPNRDEPLTYKEFKENFEIYNGEAYSIDGTEPLTDDDFVVTGTLIKVDNYEWRVAVTGMLSVQGDNQGLIDIGDAVIMIRVLGRMPVYTSVFSPEYYKKIVHYSGDLDCSGKLDIGDYGILRQKLARYKVANMYVVNGPSCYKYSTGGIQ